MNIRFESPLPAAIGRTMVEVTRILEAHKRNRDLLTCLWHQQGGHCFYCGTDTSLELSADHPQRATRDHIFPKSKRKNNSSKSWNPSVAACYVCNAERGHLPWHEYIAVHAIRSGATHAVKV